MVPSGLTEGRIVHYVAPQKRTHHAAIVARLIQGTFGHVDLVVFSSDGITFAHGVEADLDPHANAPHSWHWPEHVA